MHIALVADEAMAEVFFATGVDLEKKVKRYISIDQIPPKPDVVFFLYDEQIVEASLNTLLNLDCVVVVNAVILTLHNLPENVSRINAWPGFLQRNIKEVALRQNHSEKLEKVFTFLGWTYKLVADVPGMVAARIIAMIINEAWFALADGVSTRQNIDTAMKLGTNYPLGPFEWGDKIGLNKIINLLQQLSRLNRRYAPAMLLVKENESNGLDC